MRLRPGSVLRGRPEAPGEPITRKRASYVRRGPPWVVDYAHQHEPGGVVTLTVHGMTSGRAHAIILLERFIRYVAEHDDVWFATLSEIHDRWRDEPR